MSFIKVRHYFELSYNSFDIPYMIITPDYAKNMLSISSENEMEIMVIPVIDYKKISKLQRPQVYIAKKEWNRRIRPMLQRWMIYEVEFHEPNGLTVATSVDYDNLDIKIGIAQCSEIDDFDSKRGKHIAVDRLNKADKTKFGYFELSFTEEDMMNGLSTLIDEAVSQYMSAAKCRKVIVASKFDDESNI